MKRVLNSRYEIISLIEQGGYGAVYRARDIKTGELKAIKASIDNSVAYQEQFRREANVLQSLAHPNLPKVTDFFSEDEVHYLVMDFIEGDTLKSIINSDGPQPYSFILHWLNQIAHALIFLHSKKPPILHRDIKPSNIIITPSGQAVLVDFGLVKIQENQKTVTAAKGITPGYSPPEQYGHEGATDVRSDIYALTATIYFSLVGLTPQECIQRFENDNISIGLEKISGIPESIKIAILKGMSLNPKNRFDTVSELIQYINSQSADITKPAQANQNLHKRPTINSFDLNPSISVTNLKLKSTIRFKKGKVNGTTSIQLDWDDNLEPGLAYWIVRKSHSKPMNPDDGIHWISKDNKFEDSTIGNGIPVYYGVYAYNGKNTSKYCIYSREIMRTDDVEDLQAIRENNSINLSWLSPERVDYYIVRKSIYSPPFSILDGEEVNTTKCQINNERMVLIDQNLISKIKYFYTVFCRYRKSRRDTIVTSQGISIRA